MYAERKHKHDAEDNEASRNVIRQIEKIKVHRHWGQPYVRPSRLQSFPELS